MDKYVYPKLPAAICALPFVRLSGSGLANCLFVYARAIKQILTHGGELITPTWANLSLGPYIRHQQDKRHYLGLFSSANEISGIKKLLLLSVCKRRIKVIEGLDPYFADLLDNAKEICRYIEIHVKPNVLLSVKEYDFSNCVAIHIRMGDYPEKFRVPISWYLLKIDELKKQNPDYKFLIFSDGSDYELNELLSVTDVKRVFFGNALADIFAISKCCYMIGSDSTFSGWGAFLGQVPCVFYRKHFGPVLKDSSKEIVENNENLW